MVKIKLLIINLIVWGLVFYGLAHAEEDKDKGPHSQCPKTLIKDQDKCLTCHTSPGFRLKERFPDEGYNYPNHETKILFESEERKGYFYLTNIEDKKVSEAFQYFAKHGIKHVIMEIHSPGGSLFNASRIVGIMEEWEAKGMIVETRVYGFAASAGFLIAASGTMGHRMVAKSAELMWHELMTFKMFDISGPSDKEDEARVLRHLQDTQNSRLAEISHLSKEELDKKVRKQEFWMNGKQAVEFGFADGYLN